MSALFASNAFRALLIAGILAAAAAFLAPAARGASSIKTAAEQATTELSPGESQLSYGSTLILADGDWSWHNFVKFWLRQGGTLNGVLGTVSLVALVAVLIILSKGRA